MRRPLLAMTVTAGLTVALAACGGGPATPGVLTGRVFAPCARLGDHLVGGVTVDVYTPLYQGKWQGALTRVRQLGTRSGEPVVARPTVPSGTVYRVELPPGRYIAGVGQQANLVTVSSGRVTTADFPSECI